MINEQEIKDGNRLIAEFLGRTFSEDKGDGEVGYSFPKNGRFDQRLMPIWMRYHNSWDWLLPIVEKIWRMGKMISLNLYTENKGTVNCKIYNFELGSPYQEEETPSPIETVWRTVVSFITWYNTQQHGK